MDKHRLELLKAEISPLRAEVNQNIERMANNENFCAGAFAALISFAISQQQTFELSLSASILSLAIYVFGLARFKVISKHTSIVDRYLSKIERELSEQGGWAVWYAENEPKSFPTYSATRSYFWAGLFIVIVSWLCLLIYRHS